MERSIEDLCDEVVYKMRENGICVDDAVNMLSEDSEERENMWRFLEMEYGIY